MNRRIKELRNSLCLTQQAFAERIGLRQNSIALVECGKRNLSSQAILSICREFNVNREWLETGEGEMWQPKMNETFDALSQEYHLDPMESAAVRAFVSLPEEKRSAVLDAVRAIVREMDMAKLAEIEAENAELESRTSDPADIDDSQMA